MIRRQIHDLPATKDERIYPVEDIVLILCQSWTIPILQAMFAGATDFDHLVTQLDIERNVLASKLQKLLDAKLVFRSQSQKSISYCLTLFGKRTWPLVTSIQSLKATYD